LFFCSSPFFLQGKKVGEDETPEPVALLKKLKDKCLRRLDVYWSYELCIDQHVRQYHEDVVTTKKGEKEKDVTEHFLGRSKKILAQRGDDDLMNPQKTTTATPTFQYEGKTRAYYSELYSGGDSCDLTGNPRTTEVRYICDKEALHAMGSMQEQSICNYLVVVHTSLLCSHPDFLTQTAVTHKIACVPSSGLTKTKPAALAAIEEVRAAEIQDIRDRDQEEAAVRTAAKEKRDAKLKADSAGGSVNTNRGFRAAPGTTGGTTGGTSGSAGGSGNSATASELDPIKIAEKQKQHLTTFKQMLKGKHCFNGGTGWWQIEYCYQDSVSQIHRNEDGTKDVVTLGKWNLDYQKKMHNAAKKTKGVKGSAVPHATQYFKGGDFCEETRAARKVKVKMICTQTLKDGLVSLELVETNTCEYTLKVMTPMVCPLIANIKDFDGLIDFSAPSTPTKEEKAAEAAQAKIKAKSEAVARQQEQSIATMKARSEKKEKEKVEKMTPENAAAALAASKKLLAKFLKGKHCFSGGQGWWQFEYCYKKHVRQTHRNDDGTQQIVNLGAWNAGYHATQAEIQPADGPNTATAYFEAGDYCEEIKDTRKVRVKMQCSNKLTGGQVSLALSETSVCKYLLTVESPMFCAMMRSKGNDGLFRADVTP
jgi:endoplasmic reticulum lectin 1